MIQSHFIFILKLFKHVFRLFFISIILTNCIYSQNTWTKIIGGPENETAWSSIALSDGNFLMVSTKKVTRIGSNQLINQTYLVKLKPTGSIIWEKIYGDSIIDNRTYSAVEDEMGNIFLACNWNGASLIKINDTGEFLWQKFYSDPIYSFGAIRIFGNNIIIFTSCLIKGHFTKGILKTDRLGIAIWNKFYTDTSRYEANYNNLLAFNNGYFIVGSRFINQNSYGAILNIDTSGNILWEKLTAQGMTFYSIVQNSDYSFIATGNYVIPVIAFAVAYSFDLNGNTKWVKFISSDTMSSCISIVKASENKFAIAGGGNDANGKFLLMDSTGYIQSYINHNHNIFIGYNDIINCPDSGFLISGYVIQNNGRDDCYLVKTDRNGNYYTIGINNNSELTNEQFSLNIYPNPFNSSAIINFSLNNESDIEIAMYNLLGQAVLNIYNGKMKSGLNTLKLNPNNLSSGIYFLKVTSWDKPGKILITKKIVYLK